MYKLLMCLWSRCRSGTCAGRLRGSRLDVAHQVIIATTGINEQHRYDAKHTYKGGKDPCTFFQYVGGLLHSHELVAETGDVTGKSATFWILYQHDEPEDHAGQDDQNQEHNNHIKYLLIVRFWRQNKRICPDSKNLI